MIDLKAASPREVRLECEFGGFQATAAGERWLVAEAKSGSSIAFAELYQRHHLRTYQAALRILRNRQDAEDAVQRAFQRVFTNLSKFREDSTFSTWVTRIAMNEALMMLRQRRSTDLICPSSKDDALSTPASDPTDERPTPEQAAVESERRVDVIKAVFRLRENLRAVILLREFQGLTIRETARRLGLTVSAVKARTFHARRHLRRHLGRKYKKTCKFFVVKKCDGSSESSPV